MKRWLTTWLVVIFCVSMAPATSVAADYVIKVGTVAPKGTPWAKLLTRIAKRLEKESNGRIKVKTYMGGKLGGEDSLVRRCQSGSLQLIGVSSGAMAAVVPELNVLELPYLFDNYKQADRILDTVVRKDFEDILAEKGFHLYQWSENGFRHFAMKDTFVTGPDSLKGVKVRSQQNKVHLDMWNALGASPVPIAVPEVPSSLQNNVVSGYDNTLLYGFAAQWYQAISKITLSGHIYQPAVVVFNKEWFDGLPADLQTLVMATLEKDTKQGRHEIRLLNRPLVKNYQKAGIKIHQLTPAEKASLQKATRGTWDKYRKQVPRGGKLLDKILKAL